MRARVRMGCVVRAGARDRQRRDLFIYQGVHFVPRIHRVPYRVEDVPRGLEGLVRKPLHPCQEVHTAVSPQPNTRAHQHTHGGHYRHTPTEGKVEKGDEVVFCQQAERTGGGETLKLLKGVDIDVRSCCD